MVWTKAEIFGLDSLEKNCASDLRFLLYSHIQPFAHLFGRHLNDLERHNATLALILALTKIQYVEAAASISSSEAPCIWSTLQSISRTSV